MKELSIEEKAKRYDEAIERAKYWEKNPTVWSSDDICQKLFPELKESEDEKMKKLCISVVKQFAAVCRKEDKYLPEVEKCIAWLEKQGEHAKFRDSIQVGDQVTKNEDGVLVNLSQLKRVAKKDKKQGEQKIQPKFKVGDVMRTLEEAKDSINDGLPIVVSIDEEDYHCNNELISIKEQDKYEYPPMNRKHDVCNSCDEQKPDFCHHEVDFSDCSEEYRKAYYDGWNNCNQQHSQLKAEQKPSWSEEDESLRLRTIGALETCKIGYPTKCVDEQINWLKSIKDRYTWQPSDEQLEALKNAIHIKPFENPSDSLLWGLYEQLKKLREE